MGYYNSFILRVWTGDDAARGMRGQIEHVRSREKAHFADEAQMHRFILSHLDPPSSEVSEFDENSDECRIDENADIPHFHSG